MEPAPLFSGTDGIAQNGVLYSGAAVYNTGDGIPGKSPESDDIPYAECQLKQIYQSGTDAWKSTVDLPAADGGLQKVGNPHYTPVPPNRLAIAVQVVGGAWCHVGMVTSPALLVKAIQKIGPRSCGYVKVIGVACEVEGAAKAERGNHYRIHNASNYAWLAGDQGIIVWNEDEGRYIGVTARCCDESSSSGSTEVCDEQCEATLLKFNGTCSVNPVSQSCNPLADAPADTTCTCDGQYYATINGTIYGPFAEGVIDCEEFPFLESSGQYTAYGECSAGGV